ncbi:phosphodiester glycosidase family protein [Lactococcus piscium]|uniref:Polysaccharide biosynthesis protein n=1 Tax=Pseudolactococcus piscium MKFS47 TaxID=297352 RepID=A0A0D6DTZ3_9LACT|nr:phosphodiester glycosidase family protein [Lactococcus piscium]CEN27322.1 Polysaccharide biosynthesis protein [Lactococcus piscium MKFS47]
MKQRKKSGIWLILALILLVIVGLGSYFFKVMVVTKPTHQVKVGNQPIKTTKKDGYVKEAEVKAETGSWELISDVGEPEWVKVASKQKLNKFTDLSNNGITIYRINNGAVLKTSTNLADQRMRMAEVVAKYPSSLIVNASAFNMSTGRVAGFQINNGKLLQDWNPGTTMQYAFVINKDGSCDIYDSRTPASTIIQNGGAQSFDFGTALIRDGKLLPSDGSVNWEIHTFIANDQANNLYVILSDTNAGYDNIMNSVTSLKIENMLLLDSGGSSQLSINGKTIMSSQDDRAVPDYIVIK